MSDLTVLAFPAEAGWLERVWSGLRQLGSCHMIVAGTIEEAREVLEGAEPRLIVIDGDPDLVSDDAIDEILWSNSTLPHPATVVVASQSYDADRAVSLFRVGVDEYLGDEEHWARMPAILSQLLALEVDGHAPIRVFPVPEDACPLRPMRVAPLRWVTAETA